MNEFTKRVCDICEIDAIHDDYDLSQVDSLARAEIIVTAEEMFSKTFTNTDILSFKTFKDLMDKLK